ncbi:hypothetical protein Gotri_016030, partial [Gossypium trilobum]|nr:hypothetical protein [Gossypium trilobum]
MERDLDLRYKYRDATLVSGPAIETFGVKTPKLKLTWTIKEEKLTNANLKALYSIFSGVDGQEFKRISKFTTTKEAWDILDTT